MISSRLFHSQRCPPRQAQGVMKFSNEQNGIRRPRLVKVDGVAEKALGHIRNRHGHRHQKMRRYSPFIVHHHLDKKLPHFISQRVVLAPHFFQLGIRVFIRIARSGQVIGCVKAGEELFSEVPASVEQYTSSSSDKADTFMLMAVPKLGRFRLRALLKSDTAGSSLAGRKRKMLSKVKRADISSLPRSFTSLTRD